LMSFSLLISSEWCHLPIGPTHSHRKTIFK
jgi:hypothetical protein